MSDVRSPQTGMIPPGAGPAFAILGVMWSVAALAGIAWFAGTAVAWAGGAGWNPPAFGFQFALDLVTGGPPSVWPSIDPTTMGIVALVIVAILTAGVTAVVLRITGRNGRAGDPSRSLARLDDIAHLARRGAADRARQLRGTLAGVRDRDLDDAQLGVALGVHRPSGQRLWASWEDVCLSIMAPRAGKTTALAVPSVLAAPGPVVATSNKGDLWAATASLRAERGTVWTFDPQGIVGAQQQWWWNPLDAVADVQGAQRLASHFVQEVRGGGSRTGGNGQDFWASAAEDLLTALLLAAAAASRPITEVYRWLSDSTSPVPVDLLRQHGHGVLADGLQARQGGAPETRDGIFETARTAAQSLRDPQITGWITQPSGRSLPRFNVETLPTSTDTLFLHSKDGAGAAAPLVAALVDQVMRAATAEAERRAGRLDPPLVAVLDEAANICRIADLPELYSHFGSRGILPITILQSYKQGARVWGEHGMDALWSAATIKVIGSGIDDPKMAEDLSRLVGDHHVTVRSQSYGRGEHSTQLSTQRERILPPEQIRALERGTALLLCTGAPVAMIDLSPWYDDPDADRVTAAVDEAERQIAGART